MELTINTGELTKSHSSDAGYDIHASADVTLPPRTPTSIPTNLKITLPPSTMAQVLPRSGLAFKNCIDTLAGVIDQSYTGEIKVLLINHSSTTFNISKGDRIAQLVIHTIPSLRISTNKKATYNPPSHTNPRGENGFGSTDNNNKPDTTPDNKTYTSSISN